MIKMKKLLLFLLLLAVGIGNLEAQEFSDPDFMMVSIANQHQTEGENLEMISLEDFLADLEESYNVTFFYQPHTVIGKYVKVGKDLLKSRKTDETGMLVAQLLTKLGLTYDRLDEETYILFRDEWNYRKAEKVQQFEVSGQVTDAQTGETLPGVNVIVKGTNIGTATDSEGRYSLDVPSRQDTLVFSFIGYQTREIPVNGRAEVNVALQLQTLAGEELVVVGYGTVQKSDLTGSVSSINGEDLNQGAVTSVDQLIQGKVAGARVVSSGGEPGGGLSISIRGASSINAGTGPLYVIDGLPVDNTHAVTGTGEGFVADRSPRSPLSSINPADIASIEILKDASATAIYGARGANGVVLITTKQGREGNLQISYDGYAGIQSPANKLDMLTPQQYQTVINELIAAGGGNPEDQVTEIANNGAGTDWQEEIFHRNALVQSHNLSFSGGSESTRYYVSLNYMDQEGVIKSSAFSRYGGRVNIDQHISDKFNWGINLSTAYIKDDYVSIGYGINEFGGVLYTATNFDPTLPVRNEAGDYFVSPNLTIENPVAQVYGKDSFANRYNYLGTVFAEYSILPELLVKLNIGGEATNQRRDTFINNLTQLGRSFNGMATILEGQKTNYLVEGSATYQETFGIHDIKVFAGATTQKFITVRSTQSASGFANEGTKTNNIGLGDQATFDMGSNKFSNQLISYISRLNYSLMDTYLLTATFRADGSSRFGDNSKYGYFPSFALGWKLTEETFMQPLEAVSTLKLRASWGRTGNQAIGNFQSLVTYGAGAPAVLGDEVLVSLNPSRLGNPDLKWETTEQWNIGLDFGFLNERIYGSIDYYQKDTYDMLLALPVPRSTGFTSILSNIGSIKNTGLDFTINSRNVSGTDFQWTTNLIFSTVTNEVESLGDISEIVSGSGGFINNFFLIRPGAPLRSYYGYEIEGIWQEGDDFSVTTDNVEPGDIKYKDQLTVDTNGDGIPDEADGTVNADDRVILGDSFPDYTFALGNTFSYKNFSLNVFIEGVQGVEMLNNNLVDTYFPIQLRRNKLAEPYLNRWTPENPSNKYPSFVNTSAQGRKAVNSYTVEDASYIRLKTVRLSYSLPVDILSNTLRSASVYVTGNNLYTLTKYSGIDPAVNSNGNVNARIDFNTYPLARTFLAGIKLVF